MNKQFIQMLNDSGVHKISYQLKGNETESPIENREWRKDKGCG